MMLVTSNSEAFHKDIGNIMATTLVQGAFNPLAAIPGINLTLGSTGSSTSSTLAAIIKQLRGSVDQYNATLAERQKEIGAVRGQRADYSKEAAFEDAQGAVNAALRQALEKQMTEINRASAGAGASAGSMRALLSQQAARDAAELAATLGIKTATDYGGVAMNASSVLEALTRPDAAGMDALIRALALTKTPSSGSSSSNSRPQVLQAPKAAAQNKVAKNTSGVGGPVGAISFLPSASNTDASAFFSRPGAIGSDRNKGIVSYGPTVDNNQMTDYYSKLITRQSPLNQDSWRDYIGGNINDLLPL